MRVTIVVVPPGGGEQDHVIENVDLPGVPNVGDYIILWEEPNEDKEGVHAGLIVRRCWWWLKNHQYDKLVVEAELANPAAPSGAHRKNLEFYVAKGKKAQEMEWS